VIGSAMMCLADTTGVCSEANLQISSGRIAVPRRPRMIGRATRTTQWRRS